MVGDEFQACYRGSPPRVWGRLDVLDLVEGGQRFTPTCVGKANRAAISGGSITVHPHVCGEGGGAALIAFGLAGSPPRVWGRRLAGGAGRPRPRFTPTCVGKAPVCLRGRGAWRFTPTCVGKAHAFQARSARVGSPPRVWGRPRAHRRNIASARFTPTCVGKALTYRWISIALIGSPPRVWGRRRPGSQRPGWRPVHPHVCGEGDLRRPGLNPAPGSPPRVWGRRPGTPTTGRPRPVHPHVCGEGGRAHPATSGVHRFTPTCVGKASSPMSSVAPSFGSPPRVWGRLTGSASPRPG